MQRAGNFSNNQASNKATQGALGAGRSEVPNAGASNTGTVQTTEYKKPFVRRRRPGVNTDLTLIKGILSKALAYKGLDKKIERYEFILHWREIVGERFADISKPECISRRVLIVEVKHSVWAQELAFMKPALLQKLALYLKKGDIVNDMIFRCNWSP